MESFDFYLRGFRTKYRAVPTGQTYEIFAGDEKVTFFEAGEMTNMLMSQKIVKAYEEVQ